MVKKKIKIFISQPMKHKTNEEIEAERNEIKKKLDEKYGEGNYEIIDSFITGGVPNDAKPLWFLGKSLEFLSTADAAIFAKDWDKARGCIIEHIACENYEIPIWEM